MRRIETAVITDEHRQPFSVLPTAKRYPGNIQMVGDTIETMDKTIGRIVYRAKGDVSSKNYLSISNLDLAGPIFVFQLCLVEPLISTIHIEVMTSLQLPLRITLSTLYGKDPPTFLGRSMRLPLPSMYSWMNLVINVGDIIEQYCRYDKGQTQMRMGRIKKIDICSNTIVRDIVSVGNYSDAMQLKILQVKPNVDVPMIMYEEFCRQFRPIMSSNASPPQKSSLMGSNTPKAKDSTLAGQSDNRVSWGAPVDASNVSSSVEQQDVEFQKKVEMDVQPARQDITRTQNENKNANDLDLNQDTLELQQQKFTSSTMPPPPPLFLTPAPLPPPIEITPLEMDISTSSAIEQQIDQQEDVVIASDSVAAYETLLNNETESSRPSLSNDQSIVPSIEVDEATLKKQEEARRALEEEEERQKRMENGDGLEDLTSKEEVDSEIESKVRVTPLGGSRLSESMYRPSSRPITPPPKPTAGSELKLQGNERIVNMEMVMGYLSGPASLLYNSRMLVHSVGAFLIVTDLDRNSGNPGYEKPSFGLWKVFTSFSNYPPPATDMGSSSFATTAAPSTPTIHPQSSSTTSATTSLRQTLLKGHNNTIGLIEVSRSDTWMITAETAVDHDGLLIIWDLKNGTRIASLRPHPGRILSAAINQSETQIATAGLDQKNRYQIIIWDIVKLSQCQGVVIGHQLSASNKDANSSLAFSAMVAKQISDFDIVKLSFNRMDDTQLVSCGRENIRVWRIHRNHLPARPVLLNAYARNVQYTDITYDVLGKNIYVASDRGHVLKIQHSTLQVVAAYKLHDGGINCIRVQNACCITGGRDHLLRVWPLDFNDFLLEARHEGSITCLAMQEEKGHRLVIGTDAGTLGILDLPHHRYETMVRSHHQPVMQIMERRNNDTIVTVGSDNTVRVWNSSGLQIVEFWSEVDAPRSICDIPFAPNQLLAGFASGFVRVFDIATAFCSLERKFTPSSVTTLLFSTYMGRWVIVGYGNGLLHVLDYNDNLRLAFEYQSPIFFNNSSSGGGSSHMSPKMKLSPSGDVLIHEYMGKITVFDLPHLRILLDSFEVWPKKSANHVVEILGIEVIEKFGRSFLLLIGERLCKMYSFDIKRYDDVSEIRVLLHSQLAFAVNSNEANAIPWNLVERVKVVADVSLLAFILKPTSLSATDKKSDAKGCCMYISKFEIAILPEKRKANSGSPPTSSTPSDNNSSDADNGINAQDSEPGDFVIYITKPQPQVALNSTIVNDVTWSHARRQLVAATTEGYLAFWRLYPFQIQQLLSNSSAPRSTTAINLFGNSSSSSPRLSGPAIGSPTSYANSPLAQQRQTNESKQIRQFIETHNQRDIVKISGVEIDSGDTNDDLYFHSKGLNNEDLLEAEDHRSVLTRHVPEKEDTADNVVNTPNDIVDENEDSKDQTAKLLDTSNLLAEMEEPVEKPDFEELWKDEFLTTKDSISKSKLTSKKIGKAESKVNSSFTTASTGKSRVSKHSSQTEQNNILPDGIYAQGDCFQPILVDRNTSKKAKSTKSGQEVNDNASHPPIIPPLSTIFGSINKNCLVWNEDFAMVSDSESISLCLFATNQRIVLTKADIAMPYTIRSVLGLCMAPLHSHVDPAGSVIHSHTIILIVTDVFDYVHHILWSWSHVGSMDTPPIATLPQCSSLDATIPPFLLKNDGNFTGIGEIVWLSEQRFASVSVKALASIATHHDKKGAVGSLVDRDQLITLEVKTFFYIAPHIVPASIHQGMGLSPPSIALERQQFLEIPGHTLFGVRSLFIEQEQQHDYLTFSTGYCCVMMELTRKLSSVQQQHYQPKVWLNDVKNRGNFLAMTAKTVSSSKSSQQQQIATAASPPSAFAILAAVNHAAELHITLFQQSQLSASESLYTNQQYTTKLTGRSTVCSLPTVNHLGLDLLQSQSRTPAYGQASVFTALELIESPQNKQHSQQANKLAYQLFLLEDHSVRLYDLTVSEMGTKNTSIRASLHGLRKVSLDFIPCQLFSKLPVFANVASSKNKLMILGSRGQFGYLEEIHTHLPPNAANSSDRASSAASSTLIPTSSNAGVVLKFQSLIHSLPSCSSSLSENVSTPAFFLRELSGNLPLMCVPSVKGRSIDSFLFYELSNQEQSNFDSYLTKVRLAVTPGVDNLGSNDSKISYFSNYSSRQHVALLARSDDSNVTLVVASSGDMFHAKQLKLVALSNYRGQPSFAARTNGSIADVSQEIKKPTITSALRRHSLSAPTSSSNFKSKSKLMTMLATTNSKKQRNSSRKSTDLNVVTNNVSPTAASIPATNKSSSAAPYPSLSLCNAAVVSCCDPNYRREVTVVVVTENKENSRFTGAAEGVEVSMLDVNCDVRDESNESFTAASRLVTLPLPYNPRRPYFYDGNLDDEGSISSADVEESLNKNYSNRRINTSTTSATSALLDTNNNQQQQTLLATCEVKIVSNSASPKEAGVVGILRKQSSVVEIYQKQMQNQQATTSSSPSASLELAGLYRVSAAVSGEQVLDAVHSAYYPTSASDILRHLTVPVNATHMHIMDIKEQSPFQNENSDDDSEDRNVILQLHQQHHQGLLCLLGRMNLSKSSDSHFDTYGNTLSLFTAVINYRLPFIKQQADISVENQEREACDAFAHQSTSIPPVQLASAVMTQRMLLGDNLCHFSYCDHYVALLYPHAVHIIDLNQFTSQPDFHHHEHQKNVLKEHYSAADGNTNSKTNQPTVVNVESVACKTLTPSQSMLCDVDWSKDVTVTLYRHNDTSDYTLLLYYAGRRMERISIGLLNE